MAIIKNHDRKSGRTYVYEQISYWDEEEKKFKARRRLIGKVDPETGEIVATGKRGPKRKTMIPEGLERPFEDFTGQVSELKNIIVQKDNRITQLEHELREMRATVIRIRKQLEASVALCDLPEQETL